MVVETALADRDDTGLVEQRHDRVDAFLGVVGMQADRGPHALVRGRDVDRHPAAGRVGADRDHAVDARRPGGCDRDRSASRDPFVVEVTVVVGPGHVTTMRAR